MILAMTQLASLLSHERLLPTAFPCHAPKKKMAQLAPLLSHETLSPTRIAMPCATSPMLCKDLQRPRGLRVLAQEKIVA